MKDYSRGARALFLAAATTLVMGAAKADLVAYWPFDGDLTDKIGGRTALTHGNTEWAAGYVGGAVKLNGYCNYVELPIGSLISSLKSCTLATWVNSTSNDPYWYRIFDFGRDTTVHMYLAVWPDNLIEFKITNGKEDKYIPASHALPAGWHHVVVTIDAKSQTCRLYLDGVGVTNDPAVPVALTPSDLGRTTRNWLGRAQYARDPYFKGAIDELAIFDHRLSDEEIGLLYRSSAASFLFGQTSPFTRITEQANKLLRTEQPAKAAALLESKLTEYESMRSKLTGVADSTANAPLAGICLLLAEAREKSGAPSNDIVEAYQKAILLAAKGEACVQGMLGVFRYVPTENYISIIRRSFQHNAITPHHMSSLAGSFQSRQNWDAFRILLDVLLSEADDPTAFAAAVGKALANSGWSRRFQAYCQAVPELRGYCVKQSVQRAKQLVEQGKPQQAIEVYQALANQCNVLEQKIGYEFEICRCAFLDGRYESAIALIDTLLARESGVRASLVKEALLLKGLALLNRRKLNEARDVFLRLMIIPPETWHDQEANYLLGYCDMLQGEYEEARETFEIVVTDYPGSSQANKAQLLLTRINRIVKLVGAGTIQAASEF